MFVISRFPVTEITHGFGNFRSPVFAFVHIFVFGSPVFAYVCISMWLPVFAHIFVFEVAQPVVEYSEVCTLSTENSGWVIARKTYMLREAISESISFMRHPTNQPFPLYKSIQSPLGIQAKVVTIMFAFTCSPPGEKAFKMLSLERSFE